MNNKSKQSRERKSVSSKTQEIHGKSSLQLKNELFEYFGEIFGDYEQKKEIQK